MATKLVNVESIGSYFESLSDPRHTRNRKHLLGGYRGDRGVWHGVWQRWSDGHSSLGRRIAGIGWSSSCRFPTEFPHAIAFVGC